MSPKNLFGIQSGHAVRQILSKNPVETMWDFVARLSKGVVEINSLRGNKYGFQIVFPDFSSSDGSSLVEIFPLNKDCVIPRQKIHFMFDK